MLQFSDINSNPFGFPSAHIFIHATKSERLMLDLPINQRLAQSENINELGITTVNSSRPKHQTKVKRIGITRINSPA